MVFQYTIDVFADLIRAYPTWEDLCLYLESEQGGRLQMMDRRDRMVLIRYQKGVSRMDVPYIRWFRSVIWDTQLNRPISVAPPRSESTSVFDASEPFVCEEFMDGFMIQCFRDYVQPETVNIATRSKIDASGTFYSTRTFRDLFLEVMSGQELLPASAPAGTSYSYLVQHQENRIVAPVTANRAWLVQRVIIDPETGRMLVEDHCGQIPTVPGFVTEEGRWMVTTPDAFKERFQAQCAEKSWTFQGMVIKDQRGNRWKFCSEAYKTVKALRGNEPSTTNRFAYLYTQNLIPTYLEYYPEEEFAFSFHHLCVQNIVDTLLRFYIDIHVKHRATIHAVDKMWHPHLYALHKIYLNTMKAAKRKLMSVDIQIYFHGQPWQRLAFLIRRIQETYFSQIEMVLESPSVPLQLLTTASDPMNDE